MGLVHHIKKKITPANSPSRPNLRDRKDGTDYKKLHEKGRTSPAHSSSADQQRTVDLKAASNDQLLDELDSVMDDAIRHRDDIENASKNIPPVARDEEALIEDPPSDDERLLRAQIQAEKDREAELKLRKDNLKLTKLQLELASLKRKNDEDEQFITESEAEMKKPAPKPPAANPKKRKKTKSKSKAKPVPEKGGAAAPTLGGTQGPTANTVRSLANDAEAVMRDLGLASATTDSENDAAVAQRPRSPNGARPPSGDLLGATAAQNASKQQKWLSEAEERIRRTGELKGSVLDNRRGKVSFSTIESKNGLGTMTDMGYGKNRIPDKESILDKKQEIFDDTPLTISRLGDILAGFQLGGVSREQNTKKLEPVEEVEKFKWPHKHLGWRMEAKEGKSVRYHDMDLKELAIGEVSICAHAPAAERLPRMELLCDASSSKRDHLGLEPVAVVSLGGVCVHVPG